MMLYNHDGSFFRVTSPDMKSINTDSKNYNLDLMSLTVTESDGTMINGDLMFRDQDDFYAKVLRPGVRLEIEWGINNTGLTPVSRGIGEVMVTSPGGAGGPGGDKTYRCSFVAIGWRGDNARRWWYTGTKKNVVAETMTRLGVVSQEINFERMNDAITSEIPLSQYESDFRFLVRLSHENRCALRMGYTKRGLAASMVDYSLVTASGYVGNVTGSESSLKLEYGTSEANVLSYTWTDDAMDSANGQGVKIAWVDGKPQIYKYVVEDEKVVAYRLNEELLAERFKAEGAQSGFQLMLDYVNQTDFNSKTVQQYFTREVLTTAPQGSGIKVSAKMMGDPLLTNGMVASFGKGFPDRIGAKDKTWWVKSATHSITPQGYTTDLEIWDALAETPTGMRL